MNKTTMFTAAAVCLLGSLSASADFGVGGDETNNDRLVPSAAVWTVLVAEPIQIANQATHCVATGSADAQNPQLGADNGYRFTLSVDNMQPAVDGPCERTVEFDNGGIRVKEVSTTCPLRNLAPGVHTIYWLARKAAPASANLTVADNSMTFVCMNQLMDLDGPGDGMPD